MDFNVFLYFCNVKTASSNNICISKYLFEKRSFFKSRKWKCGKVFHNL